MSDNIIQLNEDLIKHDFAGQNLGISKVRNVIRRIEYLCKMEPQMKEALRMWRARPVVTRYDILEGWLCYYERDLSNLPLVRKRCLSNDSILLRAQMNPDKRGFRKVRMCTKKFQPG